MTTLTAHQGLSDADLDRVAGGEPLQSVLQGSAKMFEILSNVLKSQQDAAKSLANNTRA